MSLLARLRFRLRHLLWQWSEPVIGKFYADGIRAGHPDWLSSLNWKRAMREWREREPKDGQ